MAPATCEKAEDCSNRYPYPWLVVSLAVHSRELACNLQLNSVCIVSILRLNSLLVLAHNEQDAMFYSAPPIYWAAIEMNLAIVCACVPALKPLVVKFVPAFSSRRSGNDSSQRTGNSKASKPAHSFQKLSGKGSSSAMHTSDMEQGSVDTELGTVTALPAVHHQYSDMGHIRVTHQFDQKSDRRPSDSSSKRLVLQGQYFKT